MARQYQGNHPDPAEGWARVSPVIQADGSSWFVFRRAQEHSEEWATYKISAVDRAPGKANYWVARNDATRQIGFGRDFALMRSERPGLHAEVEAVMEGFTQSK